MVKDKKSFFLICIITLNFTNSMIINDSVTQVETFYRASYQNLDTLCDSPKEKKLAMCWKVLYSVTSLNLGFSIYQYYFNKNASSTESFECQSRNIKFTTESHMYESLDEYQQDMVPCYARHNPIRTGPLVDDYYNYIFITGGHNYDSLFVYVCVQKVKYDECFVVRFLRQVGINNLTNRLPFSPEELEEELQTLKELSFNENASEIETLYIRFKNSEENMKLLDISGFENTKKMAICAIILRRGYFIRGEEAQFLGRDIIISNNWSMSGEEHKINFWVLISENENYNFYEIMYPCYTTSTDSSSSSVDSSNAKFWISGGFRTNSIIVYKESDNGYNLILFVENWNFDEIE